MAMKSVNISVERLLEQEVEVIGRDGEEKYIKPFDFSEELTYLAGKIDFYEGIDGHTADIDEEDEEGENTTEEGKKENESKQQNEWPWSSVHSKLRLALTETCVMLDVLQTLNKRKYFILAPIQQNPELEKQTVQMLEKRKYLAKVGAYIGSGASGLGVSPHIKTEPIVIDGNTNKDKDAEYYTQLMELRQFWRVKKSGNQITGDLSYRTSGSRFWHPGLFEVKAESDESEEDDKEEKKKLAITLSPDLAKSSQIVVQLVDKEKQCNWRAVSNAITLEDNFVNSWEKEMTKAQQHLFNKEIFSQLSNDAFQGSFLGINVLNSQIKCTMTDNAEVTITHNVHSATNVVDMGTETKETSNDLTLLLSALLYQQHRNVSKFSTPYPATSNFYGKQSKSSSVINIIHRKPNDIGKSILYEFMKQAEHKLWIHRVNDFLYDENQKYPEPAIAFHWNVLKSRLKSVLTITLSSVYRHKCISSNFSVTIDDRGFHIFCKDMISVDVPFDMDMLALVLSNNIYKHLQDVVQEVSKQHSWVMATPKMGNNILLSNQAEARPPLLLRSNSQGKFVQIYLNDMQNIKVEISKEREAKELPLDDNFKMLNKEKLSVSWALLPGETFIEKCEALFIFV